MPVPDGHSQASRVACRQDPEAVRHHHDSRVQPSTTTSRVIPVASRRDLERFIRLPERLYRGNRNWVAPLRIERRRFLDPRTNPFFEHADVRLFLAVAPDGEVRGRIAAIVNHAHLAQHHDAVGFFGLFEAGTTPALPTRCYRPLPRCAATAWNACVAGKHVGERRTGLDRGL
jgi:hypothetical protein